MRNYFLNFKGIKKLILPSLLIFGLNNSFSQEVDNSKHFSAFLGSTTQREKTLWNGKVKYYNQNNIMFAEGSEIPGERNRVGVLFKVADIGGNKEKRDLEFLVGPQMDIGKFNVDNKENEIKGGNAEGIGYGLSAQAKGRAFVGDFKFSGNLTLNPKYVGNSFDFDARTGLEILYKNMVGIRSEAQINANKLGNVTRTNLVYKPNENTSIEIGKVRDANGNRYNNWKISFNVLGNHLPRFKGLNR